MNATIGHYRNIALLTCLAIACCPLGNAAAQIVSPSTVRLQASLLIVQEPTRLLNGAGTIKKLSSELKMKRGGWMQIGTLTADDVRNLLIELEEDPKIRTVAHPLLSTQIGRQASFSAPVASAHRAAKPSEYIKSSVQVMPTIHDGKLKLLANAQFTVRSSVGKGTSTQNATGSATGKPLVLVFFNKPPAGATPQMLLLAITAQTPQVTWGKFPGPQETGGRVLHIRIDNLPAGAKPGVRYDVYQVVNGRQQAEPVVKGAMIFSIASRVAQGEPDGGNTVALRVSLKQSDALVKASQTGRLKLHRTGGEGGLAATNEFAGELAAPRKSAFPASRAKTTATGGRVLALESINAPVEIALNQRLFISSAVAVESTESGSSLIEFSHQPKKHLIEVRGTRKGFGSFVALTADGKVRQVEVVVTSDTRLLAHRLKQLYPSAVVKIYDLESGVLLRGEVDSEADADAIESIAEQFFPKVLQQLTVKKKNSLPPGAAAGLSGYGSFGDDGDFDAGEGGYGPAVGLGGAGPGVAIPEPAGKRRAGDAVKAVATEKKLLEDIRNEMRALRREVKKLVTLLSRRSTKADEKKGGDEAVQSFNNLLGVGGMLNKTGAPAAEDAAGGRPRADAGKDIAWKPIGLQLQPARTAHQKYRGGMKVIDVRTGSPAATSGIRKGDILVGLGTYETTSARNVGFVLQKHPVTDSGLKFFIVRDKNTLQGVLKPAASGERAP